MKLRLWRYSDDNTIFLKRSTTSTVSYTNLPAEAIPSSTLSYGHHSIFEKCKSLKLSGTLHRKRVLTVYDAVIAINYTFYHLFVSYFWQSKQYCLLSSTLCNDYHFVRYYWAIRLLFCTLSPIQFLLNSTLFMAHCCFYQTYN